MTEPIPGSLPVSVNGIGRIPDPRSAGCVPPLEVIGQIGAVLDNAVNIYQLSHLLQSLGRGYRPGSFAEHLFSLNCLLFGFPVSLDLIKFSYLIPTGSVRRRSGR